MIPLAEQALGWKQDFQSARDEFAQLKFAPDYEYYQTDLLHIYDLMIERAEIYYQTTLYAVDNPSYKVGTKWVRPRADVQSGKVGGGRSSTVVADELRAAVADFEHELDEMP